LYSGSSISFGASLWILSREGDTGVTQSNSVSKRDGGMDRFFTAFATHVAKWTGSHWTFAIVAVLVVVSLVTIGVEDTNIAISIATLLMVFVLQNRTETPLRCISKWTR
jgi:hypothetical protein